MTSTSGRDIKSATVSAAKFLLPTVPIILLSQVLVASLLINLSQVAINRAWISPTNLPNLIITTYQDKQVIDDLRSSLVTHSGHLDSALALAARYSFANMDWSRYLAQSALSRADVDAAQAGFVDQEDDVVRDYYEGLTFLLDGNVPAASQIWSEHQPIVAHLISNGRDLFLKQERNDDALAVMSLASQAAPHLCEPLYYKGLIWQASEHFEQSLEVWTSPNVRFCEDREYRGEIYFASGQLYAGLGRLGDAATVLEQAVQEDDSDVKRLIAYGNVLTRINRPQEREKARQMYEKALAIDDEEIWAYVGMCNVLRGAGDLNEALDWCQEGQARFPYDPLPYYHAALVLEDRGQIEDAVSALEKTSRLDDEFPGVWTRLFELYQMLGDDSSAQDALRHANESKAEDIE